MAYTAAHAEADEIHNVALADPSDDYKCSKNDHWARQTDYKGETHAPAHSGGAD